MQPEAHQVVGARIHAEEARVRHVREPGQGVPVGGVEGGERPASAAPAQPALHHAGSGDVIRVVEIDEVEAPDPAVHENCGGEEQRDDQHGEDTRRNPPWFRRGRGALAVHPVRHRREASHGLTGRGLFDLLAQTRGEAGVHSQEKLVLAPGAGHVAGGSEDQTELKMDDVPAGIQRQGLAGCGERFGVLSECEIFGAQIRVRRAETRVQGDRGQKLVRRIAVAIDPPERPGEVDVGFGVSGAQREGPGVRVGGLLPAAEAGERIPEDVGRFREVRLQAQGLLLGGRGFGEASDADQSQPEVAVGLGEIRFDPDDLLKDPGGVGVAAGLEIHPAKIAFDVPIVWRDGIRVLEQGESVLPDGGLVPGQQREDRQERHAERRGEPLRPEAGRDVAPLPSEGREEPEVRQVGVAVGDEVTPDPDESEHWHEGPEKPEPAHEKMGPPGPATEHEQRQRAEREKGTGDRPPGQGRVVGRIEAAEIDRRKRLGNVRQYGGGDVGQTGSQRRRHNSTKGALDGPGDCAGDHRQRQKREFLPDGGGENPAPVFDVEPAERPVIQEQQRRRQGHEQRLGHQADGVAQECQAPDLPARSAGVDGVQADGQHAEEDAENVLAFGDPDHGLDPQGVGREESAANRLGSSCRSGLAARRRAPW